MTQNHSKTDKTNWLTENELTSFGNYLLSNERAERISNINKGNVTHADYENWKTKVNT